MAFFLHLLGYGLVPYKWGQVIKLVVDSHFALRVLQIFLHSENPAFLIPVSPGQGVGIKTC